MGQRQREEGSANTTALHSLQGAKNVASTRGGWSAPNGHRVKSAGSVGLGAGGHAAPTARERGLALPPALVAAS